MNGPEHYRRAEELLVDASEVDVITGRLTQNLDVAALKLQAAAVHAQLAAVARAVDLDGFHKKNIAQWTDVVS